MNKKVLFVSLASITLALALSMSSAAANPPVLGGGGGGGYGYQTPASAYFSIGTSSYVPFLHKWNFQIWYFPQYVKSGSVKMDGQLVANNISHSGSFFALLAPNHQYTFIFYEQSNGHGKALSTLILYGPPAPPTYGYGNH